MTLLLAKDRRVYVFVALLAYSVVCVAAHDTEYLMCRPVDQLFQAAPPSGPGPATTPVRGKQGPSGRPGPPGRPGSKGEKGDRGRLDSDLEANLTRRVEALEKILGCPEGEYLAGSCYFLLDDGGSRRYDDARERCRRKDAHLAYIFSEGDYLLLMAFLRKVSTDFSRGRSHRVHAWLGASYIRGNGGVVWDNGVRGPYVKWFPGHPGGASSWSKMAVAVEHDPASANQGMFNRNPGAGFYPLCQRP